MGEKFSVINLIQMCPLITRHNNLFRCHESPGRLTSTDITTSEENFLHNRGGGGRSRHQRTTGGVRNHKMPRSHSFAAKFEDHHLQRNFAKNGDEFVWDRETRKFMPNNPDSGLRHGHSDLRLDRGFSHQNMNIHVHAQHQDVKPLKPQHFKTIIFLS